MILQLNKEPWSSVLKKRKRKKKGGEIALDIAPAHSISKLY